MDLSHQIGQRLREARQARGLSLAQLAALTTGGLSKSRISSYEQGVRRLGLEEAHDLAQALGTVSAVHLLCVDDTGFLSEDERRLVALFRRADARGRATILEVARAVAPAGESGSRAPAQEETRTPTVDKPAKPPSSSRRAGSRYQGGRRIISPAEAEKQVQVHHPHLSLVPSSFETLSTPATWRCTRHGVEFRASGSTLCRPGAVGCPGCLEERRRDSRRARYADPELERHLAILAAAGREKDVAVYRLHVAGMKAKEIAAEVGISDSNVTMRLARARRVLGAAESGE